MQRATLQPQLNEDTHVYTVDGRRVISVTQAMPEWVRIELYGEEYFVHVHSGATIRGDFMETARRFGNAIHKASYYLITGAGLSRDDLHPDLIPTVNQLEDFLDKCPMKLELCEEPLYSGMYDYAGKPDIYCKLAQYRSGMDLIDIKTGTYELVGPQTAAYEQLVREFTGFKGEIRRWALHLPKNGEHYLLIRQNRKDDMRYFLNSLYNTKWREAA